MLSSSRHVHEVVRPVINTETNMTGDADEQARKRLAGKSRFRNHPEQFWEQASAIHVI